MIIVINCPSQPSASKPAEQQPTVVRRSKASSVPCRRVESITDANPSGDTSGAQAEPNYGSEKIVGRPSILCNYRWTNQRIRAGTANYVLTPRSGSPHVCVCVPVLYIMEQFKCGKSPPRSIPIPLFFRYLGEMGCGMEGEGFSCCHCHCQCMGGRNVEE